MVCSHTAQDMSPTAFFHTPKLQGFPGKLLENLKATPKHLDWFRGPHSKVLKSSGGLSFTVSPPTNEVTRVDLRGGDMLRCCIDNNQVP